MKSGESHVNLRCDDDRQEAVRVSIEVRSDHGLGAIATGTRSEHRAVEHTWIEGDVGHDDCSEENASIEWTTRWTGHWASASSDTMTLDLTLANDTCKRTLQPPSSSTDALPCISASKHTRMTCTRALAPIDGPEFPAGERSVWRCHGRGLGASPDSWVFGTTGCIQISGGSDGRPERVDDCARRK